MVAAPLVQSFHSIHPGEWYFGGDYERLHTVLGSCVALTAWHPKLKIGGMCHYLLANEPRPKTDAVPVSVSASDCRYAIHALKQMKKSMQAYGKLNEFQIGIFGGGDMFPYTTATSIGADNIAFAQQWLVRERLQPMHVDIGGTVSRSLLLLITTGDIQLKHYAMSQV